MTYREKRNIKKEGNNDKERKQKYKERMKECCRLKNIYKERRKECCRLKNIYKERRKKRYRKKKRNIKKDIERAKEI